MWSQMGRWFGSKSSTSAPKKIMKTEATSSRKTNERCWADLPLELLAQIAIRLSLIDLLCFRGTCKDWRASSSTATAKDDSYSENEPWLLLYNKDDTNTKITLCNPTDLKKYNIDIPELRGTHCLASHQGWLLLHKDCGSIFFFFPFSCAKIDLPNFPNLQVSDHVAALSAPPTSEKCVVCVMNGRYGSTVDLHVLHRGDENWKKIEYSGVVDRPGIINAATYDAGTFYFLDNNSKVLTYSIGNAECKSYRIVTPVEEKVLNIDRLPFIVKANYLADSMKKLAELGDDVSISICGTVAEKNGHPIVIQNETGIDSPQETEKSGVKGILIQPWFCQIRPDQKW